MKYELKIILKGSEIYGLEELLYLLEPFAEEIIEEVLLDDPDAKLEAECSVNDITPISEENMNGDQLTDLILKEIFTPNIG